MSRSLAGLTIESDLFFQLSQEFVGLMFAPDRIKVLHGRNQSQCHQKGSLPGEAEFFTRPIRPVVSNFDPPSYFTVAEPLQVIKRITIQRPALFTKAQPESGLLMNTI